MLYLRGVKYKAEIRITGDIYQEGRDIPVMGSENINPLVIIHGTDIESILKMLLVLGEMSSETIHTHGKEYKQPQTVCGEGKVIGVDLCSN